MKSFRFSQFPYRDSHGNDTNETIDSSLDNSKNIYDSFIQKVTMPQGNDTLYHCKCQRVFVNESGARNHLKECTKIKWDKHEIISKSVDDDESQSEEEETEKEESIRKKDVNKNDFVIWDFIKGLLDDPDYKRHANDIQWMNRKTKTFKISRFCHLAKLCKSRLGSSSIEDVSENLIEAAFKSYIDANLLTNLLTGGSYYK